MRKPSPAQLFALARAVRMGGTLLWWDRGPSCDGGITDATINALVSAKWGTARWTEAQARRWYWSTFTINDAGRAVCRVEVERMAALDRDRAARSIAMDDEGLEEEAQTSSPLTAQASGAPGACPDPCCG